MKRFSKMFSVMTELPSARAESTMAWACISVGKPGNGRVWMSTGRRTSARCTRTPPSMRSICTPMSSNFLMTIPRCAALKPVTSMPPSSAMSAPATMKVPASMRSPITRCVTGWSSSTPSICTTGEPAPTILAPISFSMQARSTISGSRAALSMTVVPFARTAAMMRFSVAPTLANSRVTVVPVSPSDASAWM